MKSITGQLYAATILILLASIFILKRKPTGMIPSWLGRVLLIAGASSALFLYRDLHFNFWDEHSLKQSILMLVLGISSFLAAVIGAQKINRTEVYKPQDTGLAMLFISVAWLAASHYPMMPIFTMGVILLLAVINTEKFELNLKPAVNRHLKLEYYLLFIAIMDLSLVIWDYQVNSEWGVFVFISLVSASLMLVLKLQFKKMKLVYLILPVNFIIAILFPAYLLSWLHAIIAGLILGLVLSQMYFNAENKPVPEVFISAATAAIWALILGYAIYASLSYSYWRVLFLLPLIWLYLKKPIAERT